MSNHQIKTGDHLWIRCSGYQHHGIASSATDVIHYSGKDGAFENGRIAETSIWLFSAGRDIYVQPHPGRRHARARSVARARSRLGEEQYNLVFNNCEHFVSWCIEGEHSSKQINKMVDTVGSMSTSMILFRTYAKWKDLPRSAIVATETLIRSRWALKPTVAAASKLALAPQATAGLARAVPTLANHTNIASMVATASTTGTTSLGAKALATAMTSPPGALTVLVLGTGLYAAKKAWDYFTD